MRFSVIAALAAALIVAGCSSGPDDDDDEGQLTLESLSAGYGGTCGLNSAGQLICWGINSSLLLPHTPNCSGTGLDCEVRPVLVPTGHTFRQISTTGFTGHVCGVTTGDDLFCWGQMLVTYDIIATISSSPLQFLAGETIQEVSAGATHDCALTASGEAFCWGDNDYNVRGTGAPVTHSYDFSPNAVAGGGTFQSLAMGGTFSCGTDLSGAALCWGDPEAVGNAAAPIQIDECGLPTTCVDAPVQVALGRQYQMISAGGRAACGIDQLDEVYCWGTGPGNPAAGVEPAKVVLPATAVDVSVGSGHACAVLTTGRIYCWGYNDQGQLGYGAYSVQAPPTRVAGDVEFASVSAGGTHTCALDQEGGVWCWGSNELGALGTGNLNNRLRPAAVLSVLPFPPD